MVPFHPRRPRGRLAIGLLLAASALSSSTPPTVAGNTSVPPRQAIPAGLGITTFYGRGYGHGVGMSQYGARGRAIAGQLASTILQHYYTGTTLGTRSPATIVRVRILNAFAATAAKPLTITGLGGTWTLDGITGTFPPSARVTLWPTAAGATTWNLAVKTTGGTSLATAVVSSAVIARPAAAATSLELTSKASPNNLYRGFLRVRLTTAATVYDHVGLDLYLRGVVPVEMPSSWPSEALKAQAIASRSYAVARLHPSTGSYDLYDDTRSQVYRGQRGETSAGNNAIAATSGVVLLAGSSVANTLYHSADGGWTENNENVFVSATGAIVAGPVSYLRGSSDRKPDGTSYDATSPDATWKTATYDGAALSAIFAKDARTNVGTILSIDLSRRGVSGRLISVTLVGALGTRTVSGSVFIAAFNAGRPATDPSMRDTLFASAPIP